MSKRRLELFEHERVAIAARAPRSSIVVTDRELAELAKFNDANDGRFFTLGHRSFTTTSYVGYVEVGDLAIEILPKADRVSDTDTTPWRDGLLEMLRVAGGIRLETPTQATQSVSRLSLLDLIATRYVEEIDRLLSSPVLMGPAFAEITGDHPPMPKRGILPSS